MGLALEKAGPAAMLRNLDVVFAFIIDTVFLGQDPPALSIFGACLVCTGVIIIGMFKDRVTNRLVPPANGVVFEDVETTPAKAVVELSEKAILSNTQLPQ
jgi:hypothetical protein